MTDSLFVRAAAWVRDELYYLTPVVGPALPPAVRTYAVPADDRTWEIR